MQYVERTSFAHNYHSKLTGLTPKRSLISAQARSYQIAIVNTISNLISNNPNRNNIILSTSLIRKRGKSLITYLSAQNREKSLIKHASGQNRSIFKVVQISKAGVYEQVQVIEIGSEEKLQVMRMLLIKSQFNLNKNVPTRQPAADHKQQGYKRPGRSGVSSWSKQMMSHQILPNMRKMHLSYHLS